MIANRRSTTTPLIPATVSGVDRVLRRISYNKARQPQDAARLMRLADQWLDHRNRLTKEGHHA